MTTDRRSRRTSKLPMHNFRLVVQSLRGVARHNKINVIARVNAVCVTVVI